MALVTYLLQQVVNGVTLGSIYALTAIGLSIVYGILRLINFAHGDVFMAGAYVALLLVAAVGGNFWLALLGAAVGAAALGVLIERGAYRPIRQAPEVAALITSLAVSIFLENTAIMVFTAHPRTFSVPAWLTDLHTVAGVLFNTLTVLTVATAAVLMAGIHLFVTRTREGIAMQACAQNLLVAEMLGVDTARIIMLAFAVGSALAAVAGAMLGAQYGRIDPFMGFLPGLKAFVAAVIGGIGSVPGAMVGGFVLGFAEILFVGLLPPDLSGYRDAFVFLLLILVLLVRPRGLLGTMEERGV
ncbi:MAG: branched-chain amino acid ABC transporter permease [Armatimonadota bacterium]|nr:branched-chain amino acid ABC transporter permease [Armatimonadota bacterium]MDR7426666.1 branched-chain amino acid ABC transporter permease [Armatimonadota bacterium]MDR7464373.1 branched-chain amino acid ABC transporter permease [Armatimonadota bacterium]MDR7469217.1 branched-chain amino acid ABC transporter permease [Armatimonadota bacterium]MDR7475072.1 branched-chain amino acid ABC transporter permease [Armatimonadota bacterium]